MHTAQSGLNHPIAIRYPRGRGKMVQWQTPFEPIKIGHAETLKRGEKVAVLSMGTIADQVSLAIERLKNPVAVSHVDMQFLKPLDQKLLHEICRTHKAIVTVEDGCLNGGLGSAVAEFLASHPYDLKLRRLGIPDQFVPHGKPEELYALCGLSVEDILSTLETLC